MRGFFFQGGYLPVADLGAQLGVSERAFQAALDTDAAGHAGPCLGRVPTVAMTWRICAPGLVQPSSATWTASSKLPSNGRKRLQGRLDRPGPSLFAGARGVVLTETVPPQHLVSGSRIAKVHCLDGAAAPRPRPRFQARDGSAKTRPVCRSAGREVASGSTLPNRPPPAGREVAGSAGSESSSELARPNCQSQGLRHTCHLDREEGSACSTSSGP